MASSEQEEFEFRARLERELAQKKPSAPTSKIANAEESPYSLKNLAGGAIEPNLSLLSGAVAGPLSGIAGMAGSMLPGPEGQGADWTRNVGNALTYEPRTAGGQAGLSAVAYPFQKLAEGADYLGGKATDITGSPAVGAGINTAAQALPMLLGAKSLPMRAAEDSLPGAAARSLMQRAIKPSPDDMVSGAGNRAINTMLKERISPTAGGLEKMNRLTGDLNQQVESSIANSPATVSMRSVGGRLSDPYQRALTQVNPKTDIAAVQGVWDEFANSPLIRREIGSQFGPDTQVRTASPSSSAVANDVSIPVQLAHALKKGTYRSVGEKAYGELGTASTEAQKALARGLREEVAKAVPEVQAPLAREAALMNVKDVAANKVLARGNMNPLGLSGLRIDNLPAATTFLADRSPWFKGWLAQRMYDAGDPNLARALVAGGAMGQGQPSQ